MIQVETLKGLMIHGESLNSLIMYVEMKNVLLPPLKLP